MGSEEMVTGTLFVMDDDSDGNGLIGIEIDDGEVFIEYGDLHEELRGLEGEMIAAKGSIWLDDSGDRWLDLRSFDVVDFD